MDSIKNFAISQLSVGINSTQLTATLVIGQGLRFPSSGQFNVVIYDSYFANAALAYQAGKAAIYRVTSRSTDTLNFKDTGGNREGQEGTSAIAHNDSGKTYVVMQSMTVKLLTDLQDEIDSRGGGVVSHTYAELAAMKSGATLVPGQLYMITNFQTKHLIANTSEIHSGLFENIVVMALLENEFSRIVYSVDFPQDVLEYSFDDNLCEDSSTPRTGWITKRKDTILNIECPYDFRNVVWRRWKTLANTYNAGTTYAADAIVRYASMIWRAIQGSNTGNTPSLDDAIWWTPIIDETAYPCVLLYPVPQVGLGGVTIFPDTSIHADYYTFVDYTTGATADGSGTGRFRNFFMTMGYTVLDDPLKYKTGNNNIFFRTGADPSGHGFDGNILNGVFDNTFICKAFYDNQFNGCNKWGIFGGNIITLIAEEFYANTFGVKGNFSYNTITGGSFHHNIFNNMNAFAYNVIYTKSSGNQFGFYNNCFINCGHIGSLGGGGNIFCGANSVGIFSLYMFIGGDMLSNIFAASGGMNTIIWNVCYHFNGNVFLTEGALWKIQFQITGTFGSNTFTHPTSGTDLHDVQFIISADYTAHEISSDANKLYCSAITTV